GHVGGGGGHFGGGGAHFSGGHFGGGAHFAPGGHFMARPGGFAGGAHTYYGANAHYAAAGAGHVGGHFVARPGAGYYGHPYGGRPYGGHPGYIGGYGRFWGGGYWGGRFWPGVHYGAGFAWFLPVLPFGYATYWWGGVPYYYYDGGYYLWDQGYNGYVATDPPPVAGESDGTNESSDNSVMSNDVGSTAGGASDIYVYPRNGQSDEQTANDRFECHKWAVSQTGFDPTRSTNTQGSVGDYRRAIGACLDARGYSVK
ncbi:MAG TPA: hypothetical protein VHB68_00665, partial [Steroidobacteraceae bacterium]|nr:hypothetical protein [Steroidobacteraceae bacterium]